MPWPSIRRSLFELRYLGLKLADYGTEIIDVSGFRGLGGDDSRSLFQSCSGSINRGLRVRGVWLRRLLGERESRPRQ